MTKTLEGVPKPECPGCQSSLLYWPTIRKESHVIARCGACGWTGDRIYYEGEAE